MEAYYSVLTDLSEVPIRKLPFPGAFVPQQAIISGKMGILGFTRIPASGAMREESS